MTLLTLRDALLWSTIINYVLLLLWVLLASRGRGWMEPLCGRLFAVTPEQVRHLNLVGITGYKIAIIVLNLVPCVALTIVAAH